MKVLILYWTKTGNTRKVAEAIYKAIKTEGVEVVIKMLEDAQEENLYNYDLVFLGAPSHMWQPPEPVKQYIDLKMKQHRDRGDIKLGAPKIPGKISIVFCTYSGPHTGINEAIPAGKSLGQFLEHIGFEVRDEWYIVGEFHGREDLSTKGRLGYIKGRPNADDLLKVEKDTQELVRFLLQSPNN
jgi:flavodoxin